MKAAKISRDKSKTPPAVGKGKASTKTPKALKKKKKAAFTSQDRAQAYAEKGFKSALVSDGPRYIGSKKGC